MGKDTTILLKHLTDKFIFDKVSYENPTQQFLDFLVVYDRVQKSSGTLVANSEVLPVILWQIEEAINSDLFSGGTQTKDLLEVLKMACQEGIVSKSLGETLSKYAAAFSERTNDAVELSIRKLFKNSIIEYQKYSNAFDLEHEGEIIQKIKHMYDGLTRTYTGINPTLYLVQVSELLEAKLAESLANPKSVRRMFGLFPYRVETPSETLNRLLDDFAKDPQAVGTLWAEYREAMEGMEGLERRIDKRTAPPSVPKMNLPKPPRDSLEAALTGAARKLSNMDDVYKLLAEGGGLEDELEDLIQKFIAHNSGENVTPPSRYQETKEEAKKASLKEHETSDISAEEKLEALGSIVPCSHEDYSDDSRSSLGSLASTRTPNNKPLPSVARVF